MNYTSNTKGRLSVLGQICKLIPPHLVPKTLRRLAETQGVKIQARSFSVWSHIVSLLFCHVGHCLSINDICDSLGLHAGLLNSIRNATAPRRNTLSHANKTRSSEVIKAVYSDILAHCRDMHPAFCARGHRCYFRFPRKLKRVVRAIDSTTIELISKCMDWAKHRKRKAAAKLHMSLDAASFLPVRIVSEPAKHHDSRFMVELCSGMKPGEIAVFDKAYVAYGHLHTLNDRGIFWVTRAKDNACFDTKGEIRNGSRRNIISDDEVELHADKSRRLYPGRLRLIRARVRATDGTEKEMTFLTNNFEWAASTICDLYRCRWSIEVFFKEIKQTLQLRTFIGFSRNAIEWQLWSALTAYLLLRLYAWLCSWKRDFRHFFTLVKGALWCRRPLEEIVSQYGTAGKRKRVDLCPTIPYLTGLDWSRVD